MNKRFYRVIFSKARSMLIAVGETALSSGKSRRQQAGKALNRRRQYR